MFKNINYITGWTNNKINDYFKYSELDYFSSGWTNIKRRTVIFYDIK